MKTATLHISEVLHGNFDTKLTAMSSEKRRWSDESNQEFGCPYKPVKLQTETLPDTPTGSTSNGWAGRIVYQLGTMKAGDSLATIHDRDQ